MKSILPAIFAAMFLLAACVDINPKLGSSLLPANQNYDLFVTEVPLDSIQIMMADSLSGFSSNRIVVGALRDEHGFLSRRASTVTIVPMLDSLDFGTDPIFKSFRFAIAQDTASVADADQMNILQTINVYELEKAIDPEKQYNCNAKIPHKSKSVLKRTPFVSGTDSLILEFNESFGKKFFDLTMEDYSDFDKYLEKIPGIYLDCSDPVGKGGRINKFQVQLGYDADYYTLSGNFGVLSYSGVYDGERVDSAFLFYLGAQKFWDVDSLVTNTSSGVEYPQYALNLTDEESVRGESGYATDKIHIRGGGGLKPKISAAMLKSIVKKEIEARGGDINTAVINKATMKFPFEFPADYTTMFRFPLALSPTTKIKTDTTTTFMGLTDSSSETEDQGEIDRNNLCYSPDFSYHMQELLHTPDSSIATGNYDIWLLTMDYETEVEDNSNSELAEMYEQMAYQSYYQSMYGGGSGSGSSYTNYYNYMMMAQYAANNTSVYSSLELNRDNYYDLYLNGPKYPDEKKRPKLRLVISVPRKTVAE